MTSIQRSRKALLGLAAFASVAAILPFTNTAQALPPGTAPAGLAVLSPATGANTTGFQIQLPADPAGGGAKCPGDGVNGYRWGTYIMPITSDPASTIYDGVGAPTGPAVTSSIRNPSGTFIQGQLPGTGDGLINQAAAGYGWIGLGATGVLPAGAYNIGIACTLNVGVPPASSVEVQKFWNTQITVTSTGASTFNYVTGVVPSAPVLTTSSYNAGTTTATVNFTHAVSIPATTGYTATVTPVGAAAPIAPIAVPAGATSFQIPGVALGSSYTVTLVATNATGLSAPSNSLTVAGVTTGTIAVTAPNAFEGTDATISWSAPTFGPGVTAPAPASYDVAISGGPTFTGVAGLSQAVPGLALGTYTATVTANYAPGAGVAASGSNTFTVNPNALIFQDITVERPAGALVLTQRCGVFGGFPAFDTTGWPGAQLTLDPVVAVGGAGTAPTLVDASGNDTGTPDPLFSSYPQRGTYPTLCGVNLGAGELAAVGPFAGRYFVADGSINQVTVLDTRDGDLGWNARGDIADLFTSGPAPFDENNSFTGDFLGWSPQVTSTSTGQSVTAGSPVGPGTQNTPTVVGMTGNPTLASAPAGAGLGIATLDARLALLIPVAADAGTYTARLSLTVA